VRACRAPDIPEQHPPSGTARDARSINPRNDCRVCALVSLTLRRDCLVLSSSTENEPGKFWAQIMPLPIAREVNALTALHRQRGCAIICLRPDAPKGKALSRGWETAKREPGALTSHRPGCSRGWNERASHMLHCIMRILFNARHRKN
jgi:hypothetical protein